MELSSKQIAEFEHELWSYYDRQARHELPWRQAESNGSFDPYKVWISELMLQQTQVSRVIPKYLMFLEKFPTISDLADSSLADVLIAWQGLGYNRRAKYLWQAAQTLQIEYGGTLPNELEQLVALPGIGRNTAGAILAYAFNQPILFVETNVRTVYFHHFFRPDQVVHDKEIVGLLDQTLDRSNPREFYWALMDYGSYLKRQGKGKIAQSKHYTKQSKFEGSSRQIRGRVLRQLAVAPATETELLSILNDERAPDVLGQLVAEGLITRDNSGYRLA